MRREKRGKDLGEENDTLRADAIADEVGDEWDRVQLRAAEREVVEAAIISRCALDACVGGHGVTDEQAVERNCALIAETEAVDRLLALRGAGRGGSG